MFGSHQFPFKTLRLQHIAAQNQRMNLYPLLFFPSHTTLRRGKTATNRSLSVFIRRIYDRFCAGSMVFDRNRNGWLERRLLTRLVGRRVVNAPGQETGAPVHGFVFTNQPKSSLAAMAQFKTNSFRVDDVCLEFTQGRLADSPTLGWMIESRCDSEAEKFTETGGEIQPSRRDGFASIYSTLRMAAARSARWRSTVKRSRK